MAGRRVLVTRAAHQAGKLSEGLRALGAEPVEVAVLEIRAPERFDSLDAALRRLDGYDWLILASANAVRALAERAAALGIALTQPVEGGGGRRSDCDGGEADWIAGGFRPGGLRGRKAG